MNEKLNLCEILKGCEGIELYSSVWGYLTLIRIYTDRDQLEFAHHRKDAGDGIVYYFSNAHCYNTIPNDEITLFPSKEQRDWSKFEKPIPIDTPMMCTDSPRTSNINKYIWHLFYYNGTYYDKFNNKIKKRLKYSKLGPNFDMSYMTYVIPSDKFNPNDIEESLKYNIQK